MASDKNKRPDLLDLLVPLRRYARSLTRDTLRADEYFQQPIDFPALSQAGALSLSLSVATSLAFTVYVLLAAARQFECADY